MNQKINSISPIDGRYFDKVQVLSNFFSEKALIKYRLRIEIEYFISLTNLGIKELRSWNKENNKALREIYYNFNDSDALEIKKIESITNHDVKAVEYFLKNKFEILGYKKFSEFIHFGLTSQDINNTAIPLLIKDYLEFNNKDDNNIGYFAQIVRLIDKIEEKAKKYKNISILAKTHGQPASPTKLGKEFRVFSTRIIEQIKFLKKIPYSAKFGGATGNFNAQEASDLAVLLRAGALPAPLEIVEERSVGAGLGADSIAAGQIAAIIGMVLVCIFMILIYGTFGALANVSLIVNLFIIISLLGTIGATLTLPGIAGIVLTIGMAVDANVLIFERI